MSDEEERPADARAARRRHVVRSIAPEMSGLEYAYVWHQKIAARGAIERLSSCRAHHGIHHFAVFREGKGVAFSESGRECLMAAGILNEQVAIRTTRQ